MLFGVIVEISLRVLAFSESALQWKMKTLLTFYLFLVSNIDVLTSLQLSQNSRLGMLTAASDWLIGTNFISFLANSNIPTLGYILSE